MFVAMIDVSSIGVSGSRGWEGFDIVRANYACTVGLTNFLCLGTRDPLQVECLVCTNIAALLKDCIEIVGMRCVEQDYQSLGMFYELNT